MALTKVGGGIIQQPIDVGIITATSVNASGVITATSFDGNVTGNVTGNLTGNVTGDLTGDVTGNVTGNADTASNLTGTPNITVGSVTATTGNFSGNLDVGGVLTYEDVTNVDAVGIVTARIGVKASNIQIGVTGGTEIDTTSGNLTLDSAGGTTTVDDYLTVTGGGNVSAGDWRFTGASNKHVTWDNSEGALEWENNAKATFGTGDALQIYHDGSNSYVSDAGAGGLKITGSDVYIRNVSDQDMIHAQSGDAVRLYFNNSKKLETTTTGATVTGTLVSDLDLTAIDSTISDTAVDVFIYDTSKDSDGGAWRKRTQHTSWYNETLNTATRGSRREFPAVAVIVSDVSSDKVTIYDGDDPDLPMWMVISGANPRGILGWATSNITSIKITALNGILVAGTNDSGTIYKFVEDFVEIMYSSANYHITSGRTIADRNNAPSYNTVSGTASRVYVIATYVINDVAMTVLPNAPIDDATGLPVPTIAVGTDSGASIIKDNGTVVDITITTGSNNDADRVDFTDDNRVVIQWGGDSAGEVTVDEIPSVDTSATYPINLPGSYYNDHSPESYSPCFLTEGPSTTNRHPTAISQFRAVGTTAALSVFEENKESEEDGMVAFISSSYNTGYQQGRIRSAFLSDTDTTNVTGGGDGLITGNDSTFGDTIANLNWSERSGSGGAWNVSGGVLKTGTVSSGEYLDITTSGYTSGQTYIISYTLANVTGSNPLRWRFNDGQMGNLPTSNGSHSYYVTLTETGTLFSLLNDSNLTADIDNFKLQLVQEEDRSLNNKGLTAYGTVTKSAVATGADLVAYGPFNNNNNFRQPYNSDLRFVQNDFSIMFWVYDSGVDQHCTLISRDEREFDISRLANAYGNKLRIYTRNFNGDLRAPDSASALPQNKWVCVCVVYTDGNTKKVYLDGVLDNTITGTNGEYEIDSTTYGLNIGVRYTGGTKNYSADGMKLALMRISGSAPSAEQVKKIYEDEKVLFQENAKCTLYGSSDAVTALAYDDDTDLLHVGTSSGRSDFQGLRRINNTTTAVTTAITAQNEFIIEQ
jgi:hypothetical protein